MAAKKGRPRNAGDKRGQATKPAPAKPPANKPGFGPTPKPGVGVSTQPVRRPPTQQQPAGSPLSALPDSLRGRWDGNYGGKPQGGPSATDRTVRTTSFGHAGEPPYPGGDMPISFNQGGQPGGMDFTDFRSQFGGSGGGNAPGGVATFGGQATDRAPGGALKPGASTGLWTPQDQERANAPGAPGSANMLEAFQKPDVGSTGVAPPGAPPGRVNPVRHGQGNLGRGQGRGPLGGPPTAPGPGGMPAQAGGVPPLPPTTAGPVPGMPRPVPGLERLPGVRPGMGPGPGGPVTMGPPSTDRGPSFGGMMPPVAGGMPPSTDRLPTPGGGVSFAPPPDPGMISPGPGPAGPTRMPPVGGPMGGPMKRPPGPRLNRLMETGQVDPGIARLALQ